MIEIELTDQQRQALQAERGKPIGVVDPATEQRLGRLTTREREVLDLLARGHSNAEIALRLHLGETTVKSHVAHTLAKIEARDRTQAVVFAYEAGFVRPGKPRGSN